MTGVQTCALPIWNHVVTWGLSEISAPRLRLSGHLTVSGRDGAHHGEALGSCPHVGGCARRGPPGTPRRVAQPTDVFLQVPSPLRRGLAAAEQEPSSRADRAKPRQGGHPSARGDGDPLPAAVRGRGAHKQTELRQRTELRRTGGAARSSSSVSSLPRVSALLGGRNLRSQDLIPQETQSALGAPRPPLTLIIYRGE